MFASSLKQSLSLAVVLAVLTGCSTTSTTDSADVTTAPESTVSTGTADGADLSSSADQDPAAGVDTVFYFEFDQSLLTSDARAALTAHAASLSQAPRSIRLEGHADERGTREYNMALGERRAKSVRDFLVLQGVDAANIETVSYGEEYPAVLGSGDSTYAKNRRVELK